ncbi:MAG: Stk1 family PASTA domain-containing Ser/Thr kinase [Lachnospiraceae bacterium]|nr:Stk1 family PASTA domain-containing Ser/Thr kinase [Lachnospiraceae bacterium]
MIKPGVYISDRYEIIDKVGTGGMADVYKAKCHRLNRFVAIKILKPEYSNDKNFVAKFRAEAQSAAGLSHPNIVNVYDVGDDEGLYYIVMELVEGITLKKFIERKGRLEIKEAVGISIQIAQGMEAAHANHIIHRDIKPQNIIISRAGKVKVTDFGIAKAATSNTISQNAVGSVHYLSPEQARGGYSDEKSDIYSLGVTLYEMLCGQVPFAGDNSVSVALSHINDEATPICDIRPDVPYSIEKIVQKCMQKKPERRYLTVSELIMDLKRSITNPDGDFVKLAAATVPDSPTRNMTDEEMETIKSAAKTPVVYYDNHPETKAASKKVQKEEEEDLDSVDPRFEKFIIIGTIVTAVALGLALIYLVINLSGVLDIFKGEQPEGTTPSPVSSMAPTTAPTEAPTISVEPKKVAGVVGLKLEDALTTLRLISEDFSIISDKEVYSATVEKGYVIEQYPPKDTSIAADGTIELTISAGPEMIAIPRVYYYTLEKAKTELENAGFVTKLAYEASDEYESGIVIRTEPAAEEILQQGETITIVVSTGPDITMTSMPFLLGMTEEEAVAAISAAALVKGDVSYTSSNVYPEGEVCFQNYSEGERLAAGTVVDFALSTGPEDALPTPTDIPAGTEEPTPGLTDEPTPTPTEEPTPEPTDEPTEAPTQAPTEALTPTPTEAPTETPTPTPEAEPIYEYQGTVVISDWPLAAGEVANLYVTITQNGNEVNVTEDENKLYTVGDFPYYLTVSLEEDYGFTEGTAVINVWFNGVPYDGSYTVELKAVRVN